MLAAASPAFGRQPEVLGMDPVRLVAEDAVGARVDRRVDPLVHEGAHPRIVRTAAGRALPVVEHLPDVAMPRGEAALGLAAEHLAHAPRRDLDLEAAVVRGGDDAAHRLAV